MPRYQFGDQIVRRKNWYMPCALGPQFDEASEDEQARILKATFWADYIANSEWEALLRHPGCSMSAKSRLKKKAAGWLVALGRIAVLNGPLYDGIVKQAQQLYLDQTGEPHPLFGRPEEVGA